MCSKLDYIGELEDALIEILDGNTPFELMSFTGLSIEVCEDYYKLFNRILNKTKEK